MYSIVPSLRTQHVQRVCIPKKVSARRQKTKSFEVHGGACYLRRSAMLNVMVDG